MSNYETMPKWLKKDLATEILADLINIKTKELLQLQKSTAKDLINQEIEQLLKERIEMYFGNEEAIKKIITKYGPIVKNHFNQGDVIDGCIL